MLVLIGLALTGCGSNRLETAKVTGTVTLDGKPVSQGIVSFTPEKGRAAMATIQGDGTFTLSTYANGDGAIVGAHKVAVIASKEKEVAPTQASQSVDARIRSASYQSIIPLKYNDPSTSGLQAEVKSGQQNRIDLRLSSNGSHTP